MPPPQQWAKKKDGGQCSADSECKEISQTMAKVKGMAATNYVGKLGPAVFYMRHGVNINRALAAEVANPQTAEQMTQRNRLTNVVRAYQANKAWMELFAYENVPEGRTLYNQFVSQNLPLSFIYLTKAEVAAYTSILAPYRFTEGSLAHITTTYFDNVTATTSIKTGDLGIGDDTTIGRFSRAVIDANGGYWQEGDQLSIIVNQYRPDSLPLVVAAEITLDPSDERTLIEKLGQIELVEDNGVLTVTLNAFVETGRPELGVLVCQSRKQGGKVQVSTQNLVLNEPASTMFNEYSGPAAQQRARRSYGGVGEPFLNPGDQSEEEVTPQLAVTFSKSFPIGTSAVAGTTITANSGTFTGNEVLDYLAAHLTFNGGTIVIQRKHSESEGDYYYVLVDGSGSGTERNVLNPNGNVATFGSGASIATLETAEWDRVQIEP